ncbi:MAG TPA: PQQ-binding-like beta-propeller repeat protein, partial [Methanothrix sp.]|nr:PQQ-binding-like beta-propeller repeat protein [Methanothrix sp.]
ASADYVTFQGDNQRTGNLTGTGPHEPDLLWSASLTGHGIISAAPAISGERLYVPNWPDMTFKGELGLACLDRADGKLIWLNPLGGKGGASSPALEEGRVFVGSLTGDIFCIDAGTGQTVWNRTLDKDPQWWGVASSPLIHDGMLYIMSFSDGTLHALSLDGQELWNLSTGEVSPYLSAATREGRLYLPGGDPALYCLNASTGELLWNKDTPSQITATPTVGDKMVFVAAKEAILALDAQSGELIWSADFNGSISSPALSSGHLYVGSDDKPLGQVSCFDAENGSLIWSSEVNGPVKSSPLVLDGLVYLGTNCEEGTIYALHADNGSEAWVYPVDAFIMSTASASDGVVYMGADDGRLYAFGSRAEGLLWEGKVLLEEESLNLTASSGRSYQVNGSTALAALVRACEEANCSLSLNDSLYSLYGLQIDSLGEFNSSGESSWRFWINYPQEAMPALGPDIADLRDGDDVVFYFGDRRAIPEDSPRLDIAARVLMERPEALFLTVGNRPQIRVASPDSDLNVTMLSPQNASNLSSYELIFVEMIGAEAASLLQSPLQEAKLKGVPIIILNSAGYESLGNINLTDHP